MLENTRNRAIISNSRNNSLRESWSRLHRSFFSYFRNFSRRLQGVGREGVSGRLDEEVLQDFQSIDKINMAEAQTKTREEIFQGSSFEWVKTERSGDLCQFQNFEIDNGIEYVAFSDGSRIRIDLVGDVVLMHTHGSEVLGRELFVQPEQPQVVQPQVQLNFVEQTQENQRANQELHTENRAIVDPVVSILEKTKKRNEKLSLNLTVKIPSPELYSVIRENFENVDEILLQNVMDQIQESALREAIKKELQNIYSTKKRKS
jgi:phosphoribosyl-AMP cyclohydrolase